jgi:hypothetical protein
MPGIPLFGLGIRGKSPFVTAKLLQNMYAEIRPAGEKSQIVAYWTPGLNLFDTFGDTPARGGIEFEKDSLVFVVHRGVFYEVNNAGINTARGNLITTNGRVSMAHNGTQIMIVDGTAGYIYNATTNVFSQIVDPDFPANPLTVCFLSGRFIINFRGSSRFHWSDVYNGLAWDALDFANAESNPDPIVEVYTSNGQLHLLGEKTTEFWGVSGVSDQPFSPLPGTAAEWGLAATWSIAKFDNTYACLIKNRMGEYMVAQMVGYGPKKISTPDLDSIISKYSTVSDATAYSYMVGGHAMYVISFPIAGETWLYDGSTGMWHKLKSFGITRHRGEFSLQLLGRTIVADHSNGNLYQLDPNALTDNGDPIEREIVGETIESRDGEFLTVNCLRVDMETGVGIDNGQGSNPQVMLCLSRDNGKTWGAEMWRGMGEIGEYGTRVEWRRLGTSRSITPKIRITDPVRVVVVSASINPEN